MKKKSISLRKLMLVATLLLMSFGVFAQDSNGKQQKKTEISVEFDPLSLFTYGFGGQFKIKLKNSEHLLFGVGIYRSYYPKVSYFPLRITLNPKATTSSKTEWSVKPLQSYSLSGEYHLSEVNKKWFFGGKLAIQEQKMEHLGSTAYENFMNALLMGYGGYTWKPFKFNLYIKPWAGVGYVSKLSSSTGLSDIKEYSLPPFEMFASVNLGYTF